MAEKQGRERPRVWQCAANLDRADDALSPGGGTQQHPPSPGTHFDGQKKAAGIFILAALV